MALYRTSHTLLSDTDRLTEKPAHKLHRKSQLTNCMCILCLLHGAFIRQLPVITTCTIASACLPLTSSSIISQSSCVLLDFVLADNAQDEGHDGHEGQTSLSGCEARKASCATSPSREEVRPSSLRQTRHPFEQKQGASCTVGQVYPHAHVIHRQASHSTTSEGWHSTPLERSLLSSLWQRHLGQAVLHQRQECVGIPLQLQEVPQVTAAT